MTIILKDWWVKVREEDFYLAPECVTRRHLCGKVFGHPRYEDGKIVATSDIQKVAGKQITTRSGSVYLIDGPPNDDYITWMAKNDIDYKYDPENPIKVR